MLMHIETSMGAVIVVAAVLISLVILYLAVKARG